LEAEKLDLLSKKLPQLAGMQQRFDLVMAMIRRKKLKNDYLSVAVTEIGRQLSLQKKYLTQK